MGMLSRICRSNALPAQLEHTRPRLYRLAYAWCHDCALADDLVQEVLAKALQRRAQLRDAQALEAWLYCILTNCWRDHLRRQRDMLDIDELELAQEGTPEDANQRQEIVTQVRVAVGRLPMGQRQVLTLVDLEGCSYTEVAQILDIPIGTVMSRLCRARRVLRQHLLQVGVGNDVGSDADAAQLASIRRQK